MHMRTSLKRSRVVIAAASTLALAGAGAGAAAATGSTKPAAPASGRTARAPPAELTGATLTQASAAAIAAVPGATVNHANAAGRNDPSGAAYEVHVTKTDKSRVVVLEDSSFKVLSIKTPPTPPQGAGKPLAMPAA
jgi:hypothetical protein